MMKSVVLVGFLIASSIAQLSVTPLTDSSTQLGVLPITTVANNYNVDLYSFNVPANAQAVTVQFSNTNSQCSYLHLYIRTSGLPCDYNQYNSSYLCRNAADPGNGLSGTNTYTYTAGYTSDLFEWSAGSTWYFGISRYSTYNTYACTYSLRVNASVCPNNTIGNTLGSPAPQCANLTTGALPYMASVVTADPNAQFVGVWKFPVAQNTGHLMVRVVMDSTGAYLYGKSYSPASSSYYNCYTGSYTTNADGTYTYNLPCYTPRAGDFYLTIYDNGGFTFANVSVNPVVCGAGMGGFNCTFNSTMIDLTLGTQAFQGTLTPMDSDLTYPFAYYYFDLPMNYSGSPIRVTLTNTGGSAYLFMRIDGYPEDSSTYGYEDSAQYDSAPGQYIVNGFEFGRIFFGVECSTSSTPCNYALGVGTSVTPPASTTGASVVPTPTTGMSVPTPTTGMSGVIRMTTGMAVPTPTTGLRMTTSMASNMSTSTSASVATTTGSALAMIPSLFLIVLIALMF